MGEIAGAPDEEGGEAEFAEGFEGPFHLEQTIDVEERKEPTPRAGGEDEVAAVLEIEEAGPDERLLPGGVEVGRGGEGDGGDATEPKRDGGEAEGGAGPSGGEGGDVAGRRAGAEGDGEEQQSGDQGDDRGAASEDPELAGIDGQGGGDGEHPFDRGIVGVGRGGDLPGAIGAGGAGRRLVTGNEFGDREAEADGAAGVAHDGVADEGATGTEERVEADAVDWARAKAEGDDLEVGRGGNLTPTGGGFVVARALVPEDLHLGRDGGGEGNFEPVETASGFAVGHGEQAHEQREAAGGE